MESQYKMEELVEIVAKLADKYTSKESTSIPYDKANQLMKTVLYCLHEYETAQYIKGGADLVVISDTLDLNKAYLEGYELVLHKVDNIRIRFNEMAPLFNSYGNENYYDTFMKGIPEFIKYYDAKFNAEHHILTLDYPVLKPLNSLCGANRIYEYVVGCIYLEQLFLNKLSEDYVRRVLTVYNSEYEDIYDNVCEIVLRDVIVSMLAGKPIGSSGYSKEDYDRITNYVNAYTQDELLIKLEEVVGVLVEKGYDDNVELKQYLCIAMKDFSFELKNAITNNYLENLIDGSEKLI